ncbi:hypothetical protein ACA910_015159 [Epithemia clementina (nom. ined.)]
MLRSQVQICSTLWRSISVKATLSPLSSRVQQYRATKLFGTTAQNPTVEQVRVELDPPTKRPAAGLNTKHDAGEEVKQGMTTAACGPLPNTSDDDEEEQEEMFVDPYDSFEHSSKEWGGPRRGGRFPEPTRYGDWERKGRCSDF